MEQAFSILQSFLDLATKRKFPAIFKFQFHLITHLDDTCHVKRENFKHCFQFPFVLLVQICWLKNIKDEQDVPEQIILSAMDAHYCVLLVLSAYLEEWIEEGDRQLTDYLFCDEGQTLEALSRSAYRALKMKVIDSREFIHMRQDGCLGAHSFKKSGATHPCCCSCFKDDIDTIARWKRNKYQQDVYVDVMLS
eukprot:4394556-Ditylum_brightwellii.AAC.1